MPANLTIQYRKAEERYRQAETAEDELHCLQLMLREIPKHKGTDRLQADLKARISRVRKELEQHRSKPGKRTGIRIPRQGAGRVVLLGGPNAGKSRLMHALSHATPEVASYPFTTRVPAPGMMPVEDVLIQLIDTPPVTPDFFDATTQGLIRGADLVLLLVDLGQDDGILQLQEVVERLADSKTRLGRESRLDEQDVGVTHTRTFLVLNKIDVQDAEARIELLAECCPLDFQEFRISAESGAGLGSLKRAIFAALDVIRIYTKDPDAKQPDLKQPFTVRRGGTLLDIAALVHEDVARDLKFARIWGKSVHDGTVVKGDHVVEDGDIVELHV